MIYIGIDPGVSGGIACVDEHGQQQFLFKMPDTAAGVVEVIATTVLGVAVGEARAMLEFVRASPQMGVVSAFTFGRGVGILEAALAAEGIPYDTVTPVKWQNAMQCRTHGDKNISKARAAQLFPQLLVTHAFADALLLAEYCRRVHRGILPQKASRGQESSQARKATDQGVIDTIAQANQQFFKAVGLNEEGTAVPDPAGHGTGPRHRPRSRL